jgi:hypothetical protein
LIGELAKSEWLLSRLQAEPGFRSLTFNCPQFSDMTTVYGAIYCILNSVVEWSATDLTSAARRAETEPPRKGIDGNIEMLENQLQRMKVLPANEGPLKEPHSRSPYVANELDVLQDQQEGSLHPTAAHASSTFGPLPAGWEQ